MTRPYSRRFRPAFLLILFGVTPWTSAAEPPNGSNQEIPNLINILVGAYNGAVSAAEQNGGTDARPVTPADKQAITQTLQRYQSDLQEIVKPDGEVDTQRLGKLLNRLQTEHQQSPDYDFVRALRALQALSGKGAVQANALGEVVEAAKNPTLKANLAQAAPYVATLLQLGDLLRQGGQNPATVNHSLQAIARHYQDVSHSAAAAGELITQLKLFYADRQLGNPPDMPQQQALLDRLERLRQHLSNHYPGQLSSADYDRLLQLLAVLGLGQPFAEQYRVWQQLKQAATVPALDPATQKLLDDLHYDRLPAATRRELRQRLYLPAQPQD